MPRVKRAVTHVKKRHKLREKAKGYRWGRKNQIKKAKEAVVKAGVHAYSDRRKKKRTARALWQIRINAFVRPLDLNYSRFLYLLKKNKISLDRKVLAELAIKQPAILSSLIKQLKK
ncbi:50S ribosomal protein L20 [Candidatus Falkowbacteria bacterium CG_4_10_14_0_2_um_filter_48_10]|uniref:Large ribosomal subunit protein bL20 n=1 Tax=Candidatus Falkowbacteria bacterium CG23_combo_of_CG06-09_8_20_14_all_49_15 TaxID=1974572 RepID=A0A2G9ZKA4_9BACT|nr:MAG: 50S ribosomal protein L20 [Candidatus Falkowbacteria bacterium CG23_combo_of_CG06-09_8_20_14_all_49_15]PJA07775.1 MAG: 50S ribosomal protein L20 [Candidatus Falkowbacteria bacterium CG_4_10_14_0_2_um_filter_48_10]